MLHHKNRIPQITHLFESAKEFLVVPLVKPNTRFVQDIEHAG